MIKERFQEITEGSKFYYGDAIFVKTGLFHATCFRRSLISETYSKGDKVMLNNINPVVTIITEGK